jgi:hypothetical protein
MRTRAWVAALTIAVVLAVSGCDRIFGNGDPPPGGPPVASTASTVAPKPSTLPAVTVPPEVEDENSATETTKAPAGDRVATVEQAVALMARRGYLVDDRLTWGQGDRLHVLIATAADSADGYNKLAFFFAGGRYLGTDTPEPSLSLAVAAHDDTTVTQRYQRYKASDALCCPSAGPVNVRYRLTGGKVKALDPVPPPAGAGAATGR